MADARLPVRAFKRRPLDLALDLQLYAVRVANIKHAYRTGERGNYEEQSALKQAFDKLALLSPRDKFIDQATLLVIRACTSLS
jgi:hypothetical protein